MAENKEIANRKKFDEMNKLFGKGEYIGASVLVKELQTSHEGLSDQQIRETSSLVRYLSENIATEKK